MKDTNKIGYSNYLGDDRLRHRIVFERGTYMRCVYCDDIADTREHCPPKVFLTKPLPTNLPVVPSCKICNNSFSGDELYVSVFIDLLKNYFEKEKYPLDGSVLKRINEHKEAREAKECFEKVISTNVLDNDSRIISILEKLAICHATYELSEGYKCDSWAGKASSLIYGFRPLLSQDIISDMDSVIGMNNGLFPEIGSRVYDRIYVIQPVLQSILNGERKTLNVCIMDWNDVQNENYRYVCWLENGSINVRIVIKEFLYAQVQFTPE